jgi:multiple sugar transport system substrate-binding protein
MKKKLSLLLALALVLPMLALPALSEGGAELSFWYWDTQMNDCYEQMFADFAAETGITVKPSQLPWAEYWTKLQTVLQGGGGPDIFWLNHPNAVTYMPTGKLVNLQGYVDDGTIDLSHFAESLYLPYTLDGSAFAVPIFFDTIAIAYNKALLADAGYPDGPPADWTWDDLREIAKALTTDDVFGFISGGDVQACVMDFILQNGGDVYYEDGLTCALADDKNVETITFLLDLMYVDKVSPTQLDQAQIGVLDMLQNDMAAMMPFGLWNIKDTYEVMGDNLGIAPMPMKERKGTIVHNLGYVLSADCADIEAGVKVLSYLAGKDHGDRIATVFAPAYDESQQIWFDTYADLDLTVFTDGLDYAKGLMIPKKNAGQVYSLFSEEMTRLFEMDYPNFDVKDELTRIAAVIDAEIAK